MIIKPFNEKDSQISALRSLLERSDVTAEKCEQIEWEITCIQSGRKGEKEAAYEIDFHFGSSRNHAVIHDLRIECNGRVAQIDHLIIERSLDIWVCESKRFSEGIAINDYGECSTFYRKAPQGIASPFEQNRKHLMVLRALFEANKGSHPKRLGRSIKPNLDSVVMVSKNARITRPKTSFPGLDSITKCDQISSFIARSKVKKSKLQSWLNNVHTDTLESFARWIVDHHKPITYNWAAKFGLPELPPTPPLSSDNTHPTADSPVPALPSQAQQPPQQHQPENAKKWVCAECSDPIPHNVAKFCWFNKARFRDNLYCRDCQKAF